MVITHTEANLLESEIIKGSTKVTIRGVEFTWKRIPNLDSQKKREDYAKNLLKKWADMGDVKFL